jgi:hypothetical protein
VRAQLTDARGLEPVPVPGFSGAAAVDGDARLIGMVGLKVADAATATAQAALVPTPAIRTFLYAHSVAPATGHAALEDAKAAVVRVICVRR